VTSEMDRLVRVGLDVSVSSLNRLTRRGAETSHEAVGGILFRIMESMPDLSCARRTPYA